MARSNSQNKFIAIAAIIILLLVLLVVYNVTGMQKISDIKTEENVGKKVIVRGEVGTVIKIGELSGYILEDESGSIAVSSDKLPVEGERRTVSGTLMKDTIFGYYIRDN